jgi:predicted MFS family arabinose efflux permease
MPSDLSRPGAAASAPDRRIILVLALACGVSVATIYFPQAVVPLVAQGLDVSPDTAATVVTAAQLGYAAGLFLLVPLGDRLAHRRLIVTLLVLTGLGLVVAGSAPSLAVLVAASVAIGLTTVVPQIIIPMGAGLVPEERRGAVTGTLLSGLIAGILLARTFGGGLGEWLGWRAPYLTAAGLMFLLAVVLFFAVPATTPSSGPRCSPRRCGCCGPSATCAVPASTRRCSSPASPPRGPASLFWSPGPNTTSAPPPSA